MQTGRSRESSPTKVSFLWKGFIKCLWTWGIVAGGYASRKSAMVLGWHVWNMYEDTSWYSRSLNVAVCGMSGVRRGWLLVRWTLCCIPYLLIRSVLLKDCGILYPLPVSGLWKRRLGVSGRSGFSGNQSLRCRRSWEMEARWVRWMKQEFSAYNMSRNAMVENCPW